MFLDTGGAPGAPAPAAPAPAPPIQGVRRSYQIGLDFSNQRQQLGMTLLEIFGLELFIEICSTL